MQTKCMNILGKKKKCFQSTSLVHQRLLLFWLSLGMRVEVCYICFFVWFVCLFSISKFGTLMKKSGLVGLCLNSTHCQWNSIRKCELDITCCLKFNREKDSGRWDGGEWRQRSADRFVLRARARPDKNTDRPEKGSYDIKPALKWSSSVLYFTNKLPAAGPRRVLYILCSFSIFALTQPLPLFSSTACWLTLTQYAFRKNLQTKTDIRYVFSQLVLPFDTQGLRFVSLM